MSTAIFPGTFHPFTIGHRSIVIRALSMFDKVIVAIGHNEHKPVTPDFERSVQLIRESFNSPEFDGRVEVDTYAGLTAEYARKHNAGVILRGVRNVTDFEYERNLADVNKKILGVETVFLLSLPEYSFISSSMVRELAANGHDITDLLGYR